ncbi:hypothetical protein [Paenibacillus riograndensis]|uniref:hypothetical protein n=1 Tax=Paenibacillus riograndensis TaxID=483937 RepID=UPI000ABD226C|nr:hypothetical protein [Paenibacillus riograndensis]
MDVRGAAAAEFIKRNFMLVENGAVKAASGVQALINSAKKALKAEETVKASKAFLYGGERNALLDFTKGNNKSTLTKHLADHGAEFGYTTEAQYLNGARYFLEKNPTQTTLTFTSNGGTYFRYDMATNEFGIINQYGGISTYFKPADGAKYWFEQVEKYAPK